MAKKRWMLPRAKWCSMRITKNKNRYQVAIAGCFNQVATAGFICCNFVVGWSLLALAILSRKAAG